MHKTTVAPAVRPDLPVMSDDAQSSCASDGDDISDSDLVAEDELALDAAGRDTDTAPLARRGVDCGSGLDNREPDEDWTQYFFDEKNIVHSMQSLLRNGGHAVDDLCKLCIDANASDIVAALTPEGLMPFSNNYAYVFKYQHMTKPQIRALLRVIDNMAAQNRMMRCVHENNFYVVPLNKNFVRIRDEVILFGAASYMCSELSHTFARPDGAIVTERIPDDERERIVNAAMFRIINSCPMKRGALEKCMEMLQAHNVRL